jgi:hypothetical protein
VASGDLFTSLVRNAASRNPARWKHVSENTYVWREGQPSEKTYDFSEFFPVGDRARVDRLEGFLFALYQARGGTGEFTPFPEPEDHPGEA